MARYRLTIDQDDSPTNPCEWGSFKVVSFNRRHVNSVNPETIDMEELKVKLENHQAQLLSYYEHGNCEWSLMGDGPQCDFDSVHMAGILYLMNEADIQSPEKRRQQAESFLEIYSQWCNGEVYGFVLEKLDETCCETCQRPFHKDEEIDSVSEFYSLEDIAGEVIKYLTAGDQLEVTGHLSKCFPTDQFKAKQIEVKDR